MDSGSESLAVLVVEDDRIYQTFLEGLLQSEAEKFGIELTLYRAGSLAEARQVMGKQPLSAVLLDLHLPDGQRLETVASILGVAPGMPVVVLSADEDQAMALNAVAAGAQDYLFKGNEDPRHILRTLRHSIERKRITEELRRANQRYQRDLRAAIQVQRSLLPSEPPAGPECRWAWTFEPAAELAGDIFSAHAVDDRHLACYLVDVSGHGVSAALLAVQVSRTLTPAMLERQLGHGRNGILSPAAVFAHLNRSFEQIITTGQFFTLVYAVIDRLTGHLRLATAGHPPPLLQAADGEWRRLECTGLPIGIEADANYDEIELDLQPGDRLFCYSDGLVEAVRDDVDGQAFGKNRLQGILAGHANLDLAVRAAREAVREWTAPRQPEDDCTMLAVAWEGR